MNTAPLPRWKFERVIDGIPCVPTIEAEQARADLEAENANLKAVLKDVGLFLHHCWCDVQMNEYSFDLLNKQMAAVDATLKDTK